MNIDPATQLTLLFINTVFVIVLYLVYLLATSRQHWYLKAFVVGKAFQAACMIAVLLRDYLPGFVSFQLADVMLIVGYAVEPFAVISFDGKFRKHIVRQFAIAAAIAIFCVFLLNRFPDFTKVFPTSVAAIFFSAYVGVYLLINKSRTAFRSFIGGVYLSFAIFQLLRTWYIYDMGLSYVFNESFMDIAFYLVSNMIITLGSVGFLLMLREIDEKKLNWQAQVIQEDNKQLVELNQSKDRFFSVVSHDMKNPLNAIMSLARLIETERDSLGHDQKKQLAGLIYESGKNLHQLLMNLQDWSSAQSGKTSFNPRPINMGELVTETVNLLKATALKKGVEVENRVTNDALAFADVAMVSTVIRNLVNNAVKFSYQGAKVVVDSLTDGDDLKICITDSGVGMDQDELEQLFRLDKTFSKRGTSGEKGTGLGLLICKEFIDMHNGKIGVDSEPQKGSTFWFSVKSHSD